MSKKPLAEFPCLVYRHSDLPPVDETMMTIHFNADLRPVVGDHVGMLHWVMDPETSGFIIGYDLSDNQVLICNFDVSYTPTMSWKGP